MKDKPAQTSNETAACEECGSFDAVEIGNHRLCAACITLAGSACAGSANDGDS